MRTLHLDTEAVWRGGQQQLLFLLEGLVGAGHEAVLLCPPDSFLFTRARRAGFDARAFQARGEADLGAARRLAGLLRGERIDLLHCHTAHAHGLAIVARWFTPEACRPKVVVARRVAFRSRGAGGFPLGGWKYHRADAMIAVSEAVRAGLLSRGVQAGRAVVVRDGVDVEGIARAPVEPSALRYLGVGAGERIVLHVAHLGGEKGQRELIAATRAIRAKRGDVRVVLVGEGALRPSLERQAQDLGLGDAVLFAGFRPPEEVPGILKAADVFAFPSVQEGLGSGLLEAMAAGLPIVAGRTGGIGDIVRDGETGLLVPPGDSAGLAQAILRLLDDRALAGRLARSAQRWVQAEGTKQRMVCETIRVYERVVAGQTRRDC